MWTPIARLKSDADADYALMLLQQRSIEARLVSDPENITLEVRNPSDIQLAMELLSHLYAEDAPRVVARQLAVPFSQLLRTYPVVVALLALSFLGWLLVSYQFERWGHLFTFQDFQLIGNGVVFSTPTEAFNHAQYWRLVTPAFLHFGVFHLAFNSLWIWELGRRIEMLAGSLHFLVVVLLTLVAANIVQHYSAGPALFGGMSGCVYGMLGYIWLRNKVSPDPLLVVAPGLIGLMVGWLVLCMTGVVDLFISGSVANGAHFGGLVTGMLLGVWSGWVKPASQ